MNETENQQEPTIENILPWFKTLKTFKFEHSGSQNQFYIVSFNRNIILDLTKIYKIESLDRKVICQLDGKSIQLCAITFDLTTNHFGAVSDINFIDLTPRQIAEMIQQAYIAKARYLNHHHLTNKIDNYADIKPEIKIHTEDGGDHPRSIDRPVEFDKTEENIKSKRCLGKIRPKK